MAGLDPAIHAFICVHVVKKDVDARHEAGHDENARRFNRGP
jgi:hypothetical protein